MRKTITNLETIRGQTQGEKEKAESDLNELIEKYGENPDDEEIKDQMTSLKSTISVCEGKIQRIEESISGANSAIQNKQNIINQYKNDLTTLQQALKNANDHNAAIDAELKPKKDKLKENKEKIEKLQKEIYDLKHPKPPVKPETKPEPRPYIPIIPSEPVKNKVSLVKILKLRQALDENRTVVKAAELLLEISPEKVADVKPQLLKLIKESKELCQKAEKILAENDYDF